MTDELQSAEAVKTFETETCSRCGGSGHYSYCQMYGTRCFKCHGKGKVYSKRGSAALAYGRQLREVPVTEVQVGWLLWVDASPLGGTKPGWYPVLEAGLGNSKYGVKNADGEYDWKPYFDLTTKAGGIGTSPDSKVQAVPSKARLAEVRALALEYQDTLTAKGTPKKVRTKAGN